MSVRSIEDKVVVFCGDIHGEFHELNRQLRAVSRKHGPIDAVFAVGDVQAVRTPADLTSMRNSKKHPPPLDFYDFYQGAAALPAPLYFIGGNHEPWEALDEAGSGPWGPNVHFLGRSGSTEIAELQVSFVSGIYSPLVSEESRVRTTARERTYWTRQEIADLHRPQNRPTDILLTHDWPTGVRNVPGHPITFNEGNEAMAELQQFLQPSVHAFGHHHRYIHQQHGKTDMLGLPLVSDGPLAVAPYRVTPSLELTPLSAPTSQGLNGWAI